jgi:hypothetical protein
VPWVPEGTDVVEIANADVLLVLVVLVDEVMLTFTAGEVLPVKVFLTCN